MAWRSNCPSRRFNRARRVPVWIAVWAVVAAWGPVLYPGASLAQSVPLRCRIGDGAWQGCAMEVDEPGAHWTLVVGKRRIGFRHDGSGTVRMQDPERPPQSGVYGSGWIPVDTSWIAGPALCWNGVCAQGDIPLD